MLDTQAAATVPQATTSPQGLRVLLAESDDELRAVLVEALRVDDYAIVEVRDGDDLLDRLAGRDRFDLIITDLRFEGVARQQIVDALQRRRGQEAILMMTSFSSDADALAAARVGGTVIAKPFGLSELRAAVWSLVSAPPVRAP